MRSLRLSAVFALIGLLSVPSAAAHAFSNGAPSFFVGAEGGWSSVRFERRARFSNIDISETDTAYSVNAGVRFNRFFAVSLFGTLSGSSSFTVSDGIFEGRLDYYYYGVSADGYVFLPLSADTSLIGTAGIGRYGLHAEYEGRFAGDDFKKDFYGTGLRFGFGMERKIASDIAFHALYRHTSFDADKADESDMFKHINEYVVGLNWFF